jgi:hypothetical protein
MLQGDLHTSLKLFQKVCSVKSEHKDDRSEFPPSDSDDHVRHPAWIVVQLEASRAAAKRIDRPDCHTEYMQHSDFHQLPTHCLRLGMTERASAPRQVAFRALVLGGILKGSLKSTSKTAKPL